MLGLENPERLKETRRAWIEEASRSPSLEKDGRWTESIAVGEGDFVENIKAALDIGHRGPTVIIKDGSCILKEDETSYQPFFRGKNQLLRAKLTRQEIDIFFRNNDLQELNSVRPRMLPRFCLSIADF
jgi:REP-associated tyrosine transposase